MNFKKIIRLAASALAAVVIAAGIFTGITSDKDSTLLTSITAEAASKKYPEFPVTEKNNGYVSVTLPDGYTYVGKPFNYVSSKYYSNGEYRTAHIGIEADKGKYKYSTVFIYQTDEKGSLDYLLVVSGLAAMVPKFEDIVVEGDYHIGYYESSSSKYIVKYTGKGGNVVIPDGITNINYGVFKDNKSITSVTFPKSCNSISAKAFENCTNLKKVEFKGDAEFGIESFKNCTKLESVIVKGRLKRGTSGGIGNSAFENCTSLETLKISKATVDDNDLGWEVGSKAFKNCKKLKSINISNNCSGIDDEAFKGCISLETVKISTKSTVTGGIHDFYISKSAFANCYSLKSINIPTRCEQIDDYAFLNCFALTELKIPQNVSNLGKYSLGYIYSSKKYSIANGTKSLTYTNADGKKVKATPNLTLTVTKSSWVETYYLSKNDVKFKYTDGTSPSSYPAPKCELAAYAKNGNIANGVETYLEIDTSDGAAFYRVYTKEDDGTLKFYKDVTASKTAFPWGSYVVVAYYKDKNGNYVESKPAFC